MRPEKDTTVGNHVSKTPFDLTDFLSKKGTPKPSRYRGSAPTKPYVSPVDSTPPQSVTPAAKPKVTKP
jgi:hypothetical protein